MRSRAKPPQSHAPQPFLRCLPRAARGRCGSAKARTVVRREGARRGAQASGDPAGGDGARGGRGECGGPAWGRSPPSGPARTLQASSSRPEAAPASPTPRQGRESRARDSARSTGPSAPQHPAPGRGRRAEAGARSPSRAPCCGAWGPGLVPSPPRSLLLSCRKGDVGHDVSESLAAPTLRGWGGSRGLSSDPGLGRLPCRLFHLSPWPFSAWTVSSSPRPRMTLCSRSRRSWTASCCRSSCQSKLGRGWWRGTPCS